jgi:outer membrane biosynthesis protein TonB
MKKTMASLMVLALLNLWIPYAAAEISEELDPMVSPDVQTTVTSESPVSDLEVGADTTSPVVNADDTAQEEKKFGEPKKEKTKKSSKKKKKSEEKKKKKTEEKKKKKSSEKSSKKASKSKKGKKSSQ